jgi:ABC-type dipeptide/oligopeptide/nickel transport system permease component
VVLVMVGLNVLLMNLIVDLTYGLLDPRVRIQK